MKGLGRVFNAVPVAAGVEVDMSDATAASFICTGDDTYTLQEAQDGTGTGAQDLAVIDLFYTNAGDGTGAWVENTQTAAATVAPGTDSAVFSVDTRAMSEGFTHLLVGVAGTGTVVAIQHDLTVQRKPDNLPALTG